MGWVVLFLIVSIVITIAVAVQYVDLTNRHQAFLKKFEEHKLLLTEEQTNNEILTNAKGQLEAQIESKENAISKIGDKYFKETIKLIFKNLTPNNFATAHKKIETTIEFCKKHGFEIPDAQTAQVLSELKDEYKNVVRKDFQKQEQQRIKALIKEEQQLEREREKEIRRLENEQLAIEKALNSALKKAKDVHDSEVERLQALLADAQQKTERAVSQAQLTKAGHVYVISNIGSFGKHVFKVGMTRRLEPLERVNELGGASVPFPFDVHMMISCDDAPELENRIHRELYRNQLNKVNQRKEFFKTDIETIHSVIEKHHGKIDYIAEPEALEYYESMNMSDDDFDFVSEQLGVKTETSDASPLPENKQTADEPKKDVQAPKTVPCPVCKKGIVVTKIVVGKNKCPHCEKSFSAKASRQAKTA